MSVEIVTENQNHSKSKEQVTVDDHQLIHLQPNSCGPRNIAKEKVGRL